MQREHDGRHLALLVLQKHTGLLIDTGRRVEDLRGDFLRAGAHEPAYEGQRVDADVEHRAAREIAVEESVLHVVGLVTAEVHRDEAQRAEVTALDALAQRAVDWHVVDRLRLREHDMMLHRELDGLFELVVVERDGLLAEHMLARGQSLAQVLDMRVVRRRDIDDVDIRVRKHIFRLIIDLADAVLLRKLHGLLVRAVADGVEIAAELLHRLRELMADDTAAKRGPSVRYCHKDSPTLLLTKSQNSYILSIARNCSEIKNQDGTGHASSLPLRPPSVTIR